jgi:hypothetical protein
MSGTCTHPDRDVPKLTCGHPLPCPWHTVRIEAPGGLHSSTTPATVTIPITSNAMRSPTRERLGEVAAALYPPPKTRRRSKGTP